MYSGNSAHISDGCMFDGRFFAPFFGFFFFRCIRLVS